MSVGLNIQENVPMRQFTSFRVGGSARFFVDIESVDAIIEAKNFAAQKEIPYFVLGRGSNVVVSDRGYEGLIIRVARGLSHFYFDDNLLVAGAGCPLARLARSSISHNLGGIHLLAGIPGTVGGAIYMNAGAYGEDVSQTLIQVKSLNASGSVVTRKNVDCEFSYRHSAFQTNNEIILEAMFELKPSPAEPLLAEMERVMTERRQKQPLEFPSAGSTFKRPATGFPGALIETAGLKGYKIGGAQVSEKHANFIINTGNATAQNIYDLSQFVIDRVKENSGVELMREVIFIGKF